MSSIRRGTGRSASLIWELAETDAEKILVLVPRTSMIANFQGLLEERGHTDGRFIVDFVPRATMMVDLLLRTHKPDIVGLDDWEVLSPGQELALGQALVRPNDLDSPPVIFSRPQWVA